MKGDHGKKGGMELELRVEAAVGEKGMACKKVCLYLMEKYTGGCEGFEGIYIYEGLNRGTSGEGLFDASTEERG